MTAPLFRSCLLGCDRPLSLQGPRKIWYFFGLTYIYWFAFLEHVSETMEFHDGHETIPLGAIFFFNKYIPLGAMNNSSIILLPFFNPIKCSVLNS